MIRNPIQSKAYSAPSSGTYTNIINSGVNTALLGVRISPSSAGAYDAARVVSFKDNSSGNTLFEAFILDAADNTGFPDTAIYLKIPGRGIRFPGGLKFDLLPTSGDYWVDEITVFYR